MKKLTSTLNEFPLGKKLTIAIDVDGTIACCSEVDFNKVSRNPKELLKARPIKDAVKAVKSLYKQGHTIVFYSSRNKESKEVTKQWLRKHEFPFHHIEMEKFVAHVYIDDRAINGSDWKQVMQELKKADLPGKIAQREGRV